MYTHFTHTIVYQYPSAWQKIPRLTICFWKFYILQYTRTKVHSEFPSQQFYTQGTVSHCSAFHSIRLFGAYTVLSLSFFKKYLYVTFLIPLSLRIVQVMITVLLLFLLEALSSMGANPFALVIFHSPPTILMYVLLVSKVLLVSSNPSFYFPYIPFYNAHLAQPQAKLTFRESLG